MRERAYDAVVVGGGLAGMMAALEVARACAARPGARVPRIALVAAASLGERTSSAWAQGGIAAAVGDDDSPALHEVDTIAAGSGLVDRRVAARLTADAPDAIAHLATLGVRFDRDARGAFALGREAAHARRRILRAGGDATGAELVRALVVAVRASHAIETFEGARARDAIVANGRIVGCSIEDGDGIVRRVHSRALVLATGGIGGLYRFTTNPTSSCGSGIALAARAGARLADLEFVQFHPTALDVPSDPLPLVTEALRGEGARLIDETGTRFMARVSPERELAPRDVVARAVYAVGRRGGRAYLDARDAVGDAFPTRFPTVFAAARRFGIDPRTQPIPIVAAAHYHMGGVAIDLDGATNVPGLYACGEVAASGVHGANRLASNSLLESVVYPERIARKIAAERDGADADDARRDASLADASLAGARARATNVRATGDAENARGDIDAIRDIMYRDVGVERDEAGLARAATALAEIGAASADRDVRDAALVGELIARAALRRRESRGSHARRDYPDANAAIGRRSFVTLADHVDVAIVRSA